MVSDGERSKMDIDFFLYMIEMCDILLRKESETNEHNEFNSI